MLCSPARVRSKRPAERQIDAATPGQLIVAVVERLDAVKGQPRGAAPHGDVAAFQPEPARPVAAPRAAEQEHRRQPERDRDDGRREVALVLVLMQRQPLSLIHISEPTRQAETSYAV